MDKDEIEKAIEQVKEALDNCDPVVMRANEQEYLSYYQTLFPEATQTELDAVRRDYRLKRIVLREGLLRLFTPKYKLTQFN